MPLKNYGVLKGKVTDRKLGEGKNPHYQLLINTNEEKHRIAINVKSKLSPSELLYFVDDNFEHPITEELRKLDYGFNHLDRKPGGLALDYVRGNLFDTTQMKPLPHDVPGPDNDLNELIELYVGRSQTSEDAVIYAFGEKWGPEEDTKDKYFDFLPGNGIHDIHMNQGSVGQFQKDNGVWQDGGLLIHFPNREQWVGIFLTFQSQSFHTNDKNGDRVDSLLAASTADIRILAALVNPTSSKDNTETVTLINTSTVTVNLNGWSLTDYDKRKHHLDGAINPGEVLQVPLVHNSILLENEGGTITLLDKQGVKIDGVSYTKKDVQSQGKTVVF
ncbi:hypothetical protein Riv7116_1539 [Rivularia sp. PCC 7116]|uniref:DUF2278 family protein n=1 Tax=Rivularia sp. PCC 7116 TaxID=373994 RepID=UPI00029F4067|nr:DUF2278 family protein [Rivularia sp. PCC 7116]AFY54099.1 hypothetical protein Riv7116_1539 [Rivularia sp. PCC 7116]